MKWLNNKILKLLLIIIILFVIIIFAKTMYLTIKYPILYTNFIKEYSNQFNVDPYLVASIINVESSYDKKAISNKEARGLMQISKTTGQWASEELLIENFNLELLFQPEINIMIGSWYLNKLSEEFNGNTQLILAAYNGGSGNVRKWLNDKEYCEDGVYLKKIPFKETEDYVVKVLENYDIYKKLYKDQFNKPSEDGESYLITTIHNLKRVFKNLIIYK